MTAKRLVVLGSTGSIGRQTLELVRMHPQRLQVVGLAGGTQAELLAEQAREFEPGIVAAADAGAAGRVRRALADRACRVVVGEEGVCEVAALDGADLVVAAISGVAGLAPVLDAVRRGRTVALANKEPLVAAGELVTQEAARSGAVLLPIDSEISAIFQCLCGEDRRNVERVLLTASGGPFAQASREELARVTAAQALEHPTWRMGPKVTVDSATLANKGFELFEIHWLFGVPFERIEVVVHHQSIIHSMVQFRDGSIIAQLGLPDMRVPIQFALFYPERVANELPRLDLVQQGQLTFAAPDRAKFRSLELAYDAGKAGGTYPAVLNGANEEAVAAFLADRIGFLDIPRLTEVALERHQRGTGATLETVLRADRWAREVVREEAGRRTASPPLAGERPPRSGG